MNIFVTGSTGFLGNHVVNLLAQHNHFIYALARDGSKIHFPILPNVKLCRGDLSNVNILTEQLEGVDAVIHAAADTTMGMLLHPKQTEANVMGTANLIKASQRSGVKKFVHISTANVFVPGTLASPGTESNRVVIRKNQLPYVQTKLRAEELLLAEVRRANFPAVILNPTFMIGPEDYKPSSGQLVLEIIRKRLQFYPPGGKNIVDVRDVAEAALQALSVGSIGENYLIANENISYQDLFGKVYEEIQSQSRAASFPKFILRGIGWMGTAMEHLTRLPMTVNHHTTQLASESHYFSNAKAAASLSFTPRPFHETLTETVNWFTYEHFAH